MGVGEFLRWLRRDQEVSYRGISDLVANGQQVVENLKTTGYSTCIADVAFAGFFASSRTITCINMGLACDNVGIPLTNEKGYEFCRFLLYAKGQFTYSISYAKRVGKHNLFRCGLQRGLSVVTMCVTHC